MHGFEQTISNCWKVAADARNIGRQQKWFNFVPDIVNDAVFPGYLQDKVGHYHGVGWYWVEFALAEGKNKELDYILKLGYSSYFAEYWLNGQYIGSFEGQQLCYEFDITETVKTNGLGTSGTWRLK
jgi:Beta-galactosidase/beta-glucuronidase